MKLSFPRMKVLWHTLFLKNPGGSLIYYVRKSFRKSNISYPLIRTRGYAYQGVRNVSFSEEFACILNE